MLKRTTGVEDLLVDAALGQDDDSCLLDRLDRKLASGKRHNSAARAQVDALLNTLGAPEGTLLRRHFGLEGGAVAHPDESGLRSESRELGRLREEALRKLREPPR